MIPIATPKQMRRLDNVTINDYGVSGLLLMERASLGIAEKARMMLDGNIVDANIKVFCGKGNNGGDGFAAARHLHSWGADVEVILIGKLDELSGDALQNANMWLKRNGKITITTSLRKNLFADKQPDLTIDALLGTGFQGEPSKPYTDAIELINKCPLILSVDIPSGTDGETGEVKSISVKAHSTVTLGMLKPGLLLPPGREYCGELELCDIGIPYKVLHNHSINNYLVEGIDVELKCLPSFAHKGDAGKVLVIAGSLGMTGAAVLCADASMRSGAGLTLLATPKSCVPIVASHLSETMTLPLPENEDGTISHNALSIMNEKIEWADSIVIGPGIGQNDSTKMFLCGLLETLREKTSPKNKVQLIVDADALNLIAIEPTLLEHLPKNTVLTPHPGEFSRLCNLSITEILHNRLEIVKKYAKLWHATIVLKGSPTLTTLKNGITYFNSTGNPGMATGGSGDVLSGVIAALAARYKDVHTASWQGVYLHGLAGDFAREEIGEFSMKAGDILTYLPDAFQKVL